MVLGKRPSKSRNFESEPGIQYNKNMSIINWNAYLSSCNLYIFLNGKKILNVKTKQKLGEWILHLDSASADFRADNLLHLILMEMFTNLV